MEEKYVWDVYQEALSYQERRAVPAVGAAIDRRAFEATLGRYNDERVQSLICSVCAFRRVVSDSRVCVGT